MPSLLKLSPDDLKFVEEFVLTSGSLKEMASRMDISYPTVRNRLNAIIEDLQKATKSPKSEREKFRIDSLLNEGKITPLDHKILVAALDNKVGPLAQMISFVINPFPKLTALSAFSVGAAVLVVMSALAAKFSFYFPGSIDLQLVVRGKTTYNFTQLVLQNIVASLSVGFIFYLGAFALKQRNLRVIDFIASTSFARLPYALFLSATAVLIPVFPQIIPQQDGISSPLVLIFVVLALGSLVWFMTLLFSALKESSGLKGKPLWTCFLAGLLIAELVSYGLISLI